MEHERIEELLAGYVLQALEGEDAREADRLLTDHVPSCETCRGLLVDFQALTGELALSADPVTPPDLLLPGLRRQLGDRRSGRIKTFSLWGAAAALILLVGLAGWNFLLNAQVSTSNQRQAALSSMLTTLLREDGSQMVSLHTGNGASAVAPPTTVPQPAPGTAWITMTYHPGLPHVWIFGMNIPQPQAGNVYELWLGRAGQYTPAGRFIPGSDGYVQEFVPADLAGYDEVMITEEPATAATTQPQGAVRWDARLVA